MNLLEKLITEALDVSAGFCTHPVLLLLPVLVLFFFFETKNFGIRPLHDAFALGSSWVRAWSGTFAALLLSLSYALAASLKSEIFNSDPAIAHDILSGGLRKHLGPLLEVIFMGIVLIAIARMLPGALKQLFGFVLLLAIVGAFHSLNGHSLLAGDHDSHVQTFVQIIVGVLLVALLAVTVLYQFRRDNGAQAASFLATLALCGCAYHEFTKTDLAQGTWVFEYPHHIATFMGFKEHVATEPVFQLIVWIALAVVLVSGLYVLCYRMKNVLGIPLLTPTASTSVALFLANLGLIYFILIKSTGALPIIVLGLPVLAWLISGLENLKYPYQKIETVPIQARPADPCALVEQAEAAANPPNQPQSPKIAVNGEYKTLFKDGVAPQKLIVVTTTGGGISAAAWTIAMLNRLTQEHGTRFTDLLRVISGASGGMVGAAFYNMNRYLREIKHCKIPLSASFEWIGVDHLSPVIRRLAFHDALWDLLPIPNDFDRGRALEDSFADTWKPGQATTLAELAGNEKDGQLPALIFTPMVVESGRRLMLSNLDLSGCAGATAKTFEPPKKCPYLGVSGIELRRWAPATYNDLKLTTAARMNASFPYVSPAGTLAVDDGTGENLRVRVVDAGFYDNFGVNIASNWLLEHQEFLQDTEILMIQIRLTPTQTASRQFVPTKSNALVRGVEWLTSPLEAFYQALFQSMSYRNNEDVEAVSAAFPKFDTAVIECPEIMPLNWALTDVEADAFENWAYLGMERELAEIRLSRQVPRDAPRTPAEIEALAQTIRDTNAKMEASSTDSNIKANVKALREQLAAIKGFVAS